MGMWVDWRMKENPWNRGVRVSLSHRNVYPLDLMSGWFAKDVVGGLFDHGSQPSDPHAVPGIDTEDGERALLETGEP